MNTDEPRNFAGARELLKTRFSAFPPDALVALEAFINTSEEFFMKGGDIVPLQNAHGVLEALCAVNRDVRDAHMDIMSLIE
ncbi:MAG: hypothetical protein V1487_03410 [bacterium]